MATMKFEASLYNQNNLVQLRDAVTLLAKIKRDYENKTIGIAVDIGCGSGNITSMMGSSLNIESLIGYDMSPEMIKFARSEYTTPKVRFEVADAVQPWKEMRDILGIGEEQVDLIYSVHCLNWVLDHKKNQVVENIRLMLRPGGRAYLLFFTWSEYIPAQDHIALDPKWIEYLGAFHASEERTLKRSKNRSEIERKTWNDRCVQAGFSILECKVNEGASEYDDATGCKAELRSLCHFLPMIPEAKREEFLQDYNAHMDIAYISKNPGSSESSVAWRYQYLTVVVEKP